MLEKDLEQELKKWREKRSRKTVSEARPETPSSSDRERRTVRVNGQEVVVVRKGAKRN